MAANSTPTQLAAQDGGAQEEQQLEEMLYRLDQVHIQLRQLRSALPRMFEPFTAKYPSPQAAFAAYMQSFDRTNKDIASLQDAFLNLQADGIFNKARLSQKSNPKGIKQWRASEHPDWADMGRKRPRLS